METIEWRDGPFLRSAAGRSVGLAGSGLVERSPSVAGTRYAQRGCLGLLRSLKWSVTLVEWLEDGAAGGALDWRCRRCIDAGGGPAIGFRASSDWL